MHLIRGLSWLSESPSGTSAAGPPSSKACHAVNRLHPFGNSSGGLCRLSPPLSSRPPTLSRPDNVKLMTERTREVGVIALYSNVFRVRIDGLSGGGFTRRRYNGCEDPDEAVILSYVGGDLGCDERPFKKRYGTRSRHYCEEFTAVLYSICTVLYILY